MAVLRQANLLGDQRIDVPHLRAIESAAAADFDVVAGRVQGGGKALIIRGFELGNYTVGTASSNVQLNTADGVLYNQNATESGTFLWVPLDRPVETLDSALNARVDGAFVAGAVNYIGLDLVRQTDATTTDHVKFLDANTLLEQGYEVPLARTLDYRIVITSTPLSALPHLTPVAKITTDANNLVSVVEDARNIMWRLGSGGDFPNTANSFAWPQDRVEAAGAFSGGDKGILSQKDWQDAVMSRVWELGGGENWYSPTADRNVKMSGNPASLFTSTADNFEWVAGLYASTHLHWRGLKFLFDNANTAGVYYNTVADQLVDDPAGSAATSKTALAVGDCIYVDLDRATNATLTAQKAAMQSLGEPASPGSRVIVAWRNADGVFRRDGTFAVNTSFAPATTVAIGAVRLAYAAGTPGTPTVLPLDANNTIRVGEGSYLVSGANPAIYGVSGAGQGLVGVCGSAALAPTTLAGVLGYSPTTYGGFFQGLTGVSGRGGGGAGVEGWTNSYEHAIYGSNTRTVDATDNYGVYGQCNQSGTGARIGVGGLGRTCGVQGTATEGHGAFGTTSAAPFWNGTTWDYRFGVYGTTTDTNASSGGVWGHTSTGIGVLGTGLTSGVKGVTGLEPVPALPVKAGVWGGSDWDAGVFGISTNNVGGSFTGYTGVVGVGGDGNGVFGSSTYGGAGGKFTGNDRRAPLNLGLRTVEPTHPEVGDVYFTTTAIYVCTATVFGVPGGTWKSAPLT